jgi:hypothetical protein
MPKKKTLKYWKTKIDKVFHEYIRRRDADNNTGYCNCITCNKPIHYTESDAGHFISRGKLSTRYDSRNVYSQCRKCNRFEYGRQYEYSLALGEQLSEELLIKSREICKRSEDEWLDIFNNYNTKLIELKKLQNF